LRIALFGATGFIGGHVCRALLKAGHEVVSLHRAGSAARDSHNRLHWVAGRWGRLEATSWQGMDVAINAVGLLREEKGATFSSVHVEGLKDAMGACDAPRWIQISALGASFDAPTAFLRTKAEADAWLMTQRSTCVLRPSVVYGPGDFSMAFLQRLARLPITPLPMGGAMRLQPLYVGDLADAVVTLLAQPDAQGVWDLGGPEALALRSILEQLAAPKPFRGVNVPVGLMQWAARMGGWWGSALLSPEALTMLVAGNTCDPEPLSALLGRPPVRFQQGLALRAAGMP
jgi:uncharacterized protein YbjT (DUF2867 family)